MKGILTLKKSAVIVAMCMAVLCMQGYSEPTPEQIAERTEMLLQAIKNNDVERAKVCIKLGADVNAKVYASYDNSWGNEYYATTNKDDPYISERDKVWGSTLLIEAVYGKSKDIVELLIKAGAGADVNVKVRDNYPVIHAVRAENKDALELLIKAGADVNTKDNDGLTALLCAITFNYGLKDSKNIAELLIKLGADVNAKDKYGGTALLYAANRGYNDTVELLIKSGADVNAKNNSGYTALMNAAGYKDTVELLIRSGADVNAKDNSGYTALMGAAEYGYKDAAELLVKAGADSRTALVWAVENYNDNDIEKNKYNAVKLLIELGADINATDSDGLTLLTHTILYGKKDIEKLLRVAGAKE